MKRIGLTPLQIQIDYPDPMFLDQTRQSGLLQILTQIMVGALRNGAASSASANVFDHPGQ